MRLMNSTTYELQISMGKIKPVYAILSHTWDGEEVTLQELQDPLVNERSKKGWDKIEKCCLQAVKDGFEWVWIDSCCIDKNSSAELSEAINSMFRWYKEAFVCYAYLSDVSPATTPRLVSSRWFTRGWTLQELIAPARVEFYDQEWNEIGTKCSLVEALSNRTTIPVEILLGKKNPMVCTAAQRMSWSASRTTTRDEDIAYCLLGLFGINMPLLYGEGFKAFHRLQEVIIRTTGDLSLLLWSSEQGLLGDGTYTGEEALFLCSNTSYFQRCQYRNFPESQSAPLPNLKADWSHVLPIKSTYLSRTTQSVSFTTSGLSVTLPCFSSFVYQADLSKETLIWTHHAVYSEDFSTVLGLICIQAQTPATIIQMARCNTHLWLLTGTSPQSFDAMESFDLKIALSVSEHPNEVLELYRRLDLVLGKKLDVILTLESRSRADWILKTWWCFPNNTIVQSSHQDYHIQISRTDDISSMYYAANICLRFCSLSGDSDLGVILVLYWDQHCTLCSLKAYIGDEEPGNMLIRPLSLKENSDRDQIFIPETDFWIRAAVKPKPNTLEYQLSVHRK